MSPLWTDRKFWRRVAVVGSFLWIAFTMIVSAASDDFRWFRFGSPTGPAFTFAIAGILLIVIACIGLPWIARGMEGKK